MVGSLFPLLLLCVAVLLDTAVSFSFPRFNVPKYSFDADQISKACRKGALISGSMMAICILNVNGVHPAFADLASDDSAEIESVAPRAMRVSSQADDALKVQKKSALVKSGGEVAAAGEERSYSNSLKKEQAIQESRKRTKAERARDMCEMMGRGC